MHLHAATFTLSDPSTPTVTAVGGGLADPGEKQGVQSLTIGASDTGSGLYRTITTVDGAVVARTTPNANAGRCADADPANDDPYEFQHRVPCPLALDGIGVSLDTRTLSDGAHLVHVEVEDAAGNRTSAFGPAMISVRNAAVTPGADAGAPSSTPATEGAGTGVGAAAFAALPALAPVNGSNGGPGARLSVVVVQSDQRVVRVPYGRAVTLSGRLTGPSGAPVAGADVDVHAQTRVRGAGMSPLARVRTDAAGRFRYVLRPGPSRLVRLGYRARIGDAAFTHSVDVDVRVKAAVTLRLSHSQLRNGKSLRYSGRIAGQVTRRPLVQIQVRSDRRWVNVCVVRSGARGVFSCRYRFRRTYRPTTYAFRALVKKQEGLPYETAASPSRRVRVRP